MPIPVPQAGDTVVAPLGGETWTIPQTGDPARQAKAAEIVVLPQHRRQPDRRWPAQRTTVPTKTALLDRFVAEVPRMTAFTEIVQTARARTGKLGPDWPAAATRIYTGRADRASPAARPRTQALQQAQDG